MRIRFTASETDGLWLHLEGRSTSGFCLAQLAPSEDGVGSQALRELFEALLDGHGYGASPFHSPADVLRAIERPPEEPHP
jgi:hypothetical protein